MQSTPEWQLGSSSRDDLKSLFAPASGPSRSTRICPIIIASWHGSICPRATRDRPSSNCSALKSSCLATSRCRLRWATLIWRASDTRLPSRNIQELLDQNPDLLPAQEQLAKALRAEGQGETGSGFPSDGCRPSPNEKTVSVFRRRFLGSRLNSLGWSLKAPLSAQLKSCENPAASRTGKNGDEAV